MNLSHVGQHVARALAAALEQRRRLESDLDEFQTDGLDEVPVGLLPGRRHVGERRQQEKTLRRRGAFERVAEVDANVGGRQLQPDVTPVWKRIVRNIHPRPIHLQT